MSLCRAMLAAAVLRVAHVLQFTSGQAAHPEVGPHGCSCCPLIVVVNLAGWCLVLVAATAEPVAGVLRGHRACPRLLPHPRLQDVLQCRGERLGRNTTRPCTGAADGRSAGFKEETGRLVLKAMLYELGTSTAAGYAYSFQPVLTGRS